MLATLGGALALLVGLAVLVLPLLVPELSRARDSVWGALVLLLGLALVTSAERLTGSPMLVVLCGGLLLGRLGSEVALGRWQQLSPEERQALRAAERWRRSLEQLGATVGPLLAAASALLGTLPLRRAQRVGGKRWIRQESGASGNGNSKDNANGDNNGNTLEQQTSMAELQGGAGLSPQGRSADRAEGPSGSAGEPEGEADDAATITVSSFAAIDALIEAAPAERRAAEEPPDTASESGKGRGSVSNSGAG